MICRKLCIVAVWGLGGDLTRAADSAVAATPGTNGFDSLIKSAPFGQSTSGGAQAANGAAPLEFRGVLMEKGAYIFSLHETATRASQWVGLKEANQPYVVESYDSEKGSIQVKYHGQTLNLSLKLAQVIVQAPPPLNMPAPAPANGPTAVGPAASSDEASRLAQVAEEIRRRRALRAPPVPVPQPNNVTNQPRPPAAPTRP